MDYVGQLLTKTIKLSCVDEAKLLKEKSSVNEQISLWETLNGSMNKDLSFHEVLHVVGVVTILGGALSDVLIDTAGQVARKQNKFFDIVVDKGYNQARSKKWDGNSQKELIDKVNKNAGYLEAIIKEFGGSASEPLLMVLEVHKNLATNMIGLVGFDADSREAKAILKKNIAQTHKNLTVLREKLASTEHYLRTGEGAPPQQRATAVPPKLTLP